MSCKNQNQTISFETIRLTVSQCLGTDISSYLPTGNIPRRLYTGLIWTMLALTQTRRTSICSPFFIQAHSNLYGLCLTEFKHLWSGCCYDSHFPDNENEAQGIQVDCLGPCSLEEPELSQGYLLISSHLQLRVLAGNRTALQ